MSVTTDGRLTVRLAGCGAARHFGDWHFGDWHFGDSP
jgi:hypothetical protein